MVDKDKDYILDSILRLDSAMARRFISDETRDREYAQLYAQIATAQQLKRIADALEKANAR